MSPRNPDSLDDPAATTVAPGLCLRAMAREQLVQASAHLASKGEDRHKGIHQARKCIRRVRAILALGMCELDPRADRLKEDLGRLCRGLSRLRDAQALVEALQRIGTDAREDVRAIISQAETSACLRRDELLAHALARDPELLRRRSRLLAMSDRLLRLDCQALGEAEIAAAIHRSERRVAKSGRQAKRHPDRDHAWHVFRRRVRRLRQQDTALSALHPALRPATKGLEEQANALGESQDDILVLMHCGRASPFLQAQRTLLRRMARERLRHIRLG